MKDLLRELAPISEEAWKEIEREAKRVLKLHLAARKLVDFCGPHGWDYGAVPLGRAKELKGVPEGAFAQLRQMQPLVETRVPFTLSRRELEDVSRGAADPELEPVVDAAKRAAHLEDLAVFHGLGPAGITGISQACATQAVNIDTDYLTFPNKVAEAVHWLKTSGIAGPYAIAIGPRCYTGLQKTFTQGGFPVIENVTRLLDGPAVWAPAVDGSLVMSLRGGDFELTVGRDYSIGYLEHTRDTVTLYLESSFTFRVLDNHAGVPLRYA